MGSLLRGLGRSLADPSPAAVPHANRPRLGKIRFFPAATDTPTS